MSGVWELRMLMSSLSRTPFAAAAVTLFALGTLVCLGRVAGVDESEFELLLGCSVRGGRLGEERLTEIIVFSFGESVGEPVAD